MMATLRVHFEGNLDIRKMSKGKWTKRTHFIRTARRGIGVCFARPGSPVTPVPEDVTCKRCLELIEKHVDTMLNAPIQRAPAEDIPLTDDRTFFAWADSVLRGERATVKR
jgi:hypothetical protein